MHAELELITKIVTTNDLRAVLETGFDPELLMNPDAKEAYEWILAEYKGFHEVPDVARFKRRFPSFEWAPSRNPVSALLKEVRNASHAITMKGLLDDAQDLMEDPNLEPLEIAELLVPRLRDLSRTAAMDGTEISKSARALRDRYEIAEGAGGIVGIPWPWEPLNKGTGGICPENFIVIYARPKNMKTFVACYIAAYAYLFHNKRVAVYSKEMSIPEMMGRCAAFIAGVDYGKLKAAQLSTEERDLYFETLVGLEALEQSVEEESNERRGPSMCFYSDHGIKGGSTVDSLRARIEKFDPDLIIVDGFYLMKDGQTGKRDRDWKTVSNVSSALKEMAQQLRVPVIGTTQANRDARGSMGDDLGEVAFADAIGQDADGVIRVFKALDEDGKLALLLTFPGFRDAQLTPFTIHAHPGVNFELKNSKVSVKRFLAAAEKLAKAEEDAENGEDQKKAEAEAKAKQGPKARARAANTPRLRS